MTDEIVIVERAFDTAASMSEIQAREDVVAWCLEQRAVRFVRSYFSLDRRTMVCLYRAPDAEAVSEMQRRAGLPVRRLWTASVLGDAEAPIAPPPRATIIVEREFPAPITLPYIEQTFAREGHCLAIHRADLLASHLSRDGLRMICAFVAPDAESVRIANRQMGFPIAVAWPATVHVPAP